MAYHTRFIPITRAFGADPSAGLALGGHLRKAAGLMQTRKITKADFDQIVEVIDRWWGGPMANFAHPMFFYELGDNALIVEENNQLVGFLLGFIVFKAPKTGYVHLVGIHPDFRRKGVGRILYETFTERCRSLGCERMKAITTPGNEGSLAASTGAGVDRHRARRLRRPRPAPHRVHERPRSPDQLRSAGAAEQPEGR